MIACASACARGEAADAIAAEHGGALDPHVRWGRSIELQESRAVVNVMIHVTPDPRGGFLVADEQEDQVRRYDANGRLLGTFGRRGPGPREFTYLLLAVRRADGGIVAVDGLGHAAVFDSVGDRLAGTFRVPVMPLKYASLLNDTLLLLGGRLPDVRGVDPDARLHLWNLRAGALRQSFFPFRAATPGTRFAANTAGLVGGAVRGDTLAAVFSLSDSIHLFDLRGRALRTVPIAAPGLRRFRADLQPPRGDIVSAREWFGRFSLVSDVFWLPDGGWLVQYQDREGVEPQWRLARIARDGAPVFDAADTPRLLAVTGDTLWFVKPGSPTPNEWTAATLRD